VNVMPKKDGQDRRQFIAGGLTGLAAAALTPSGLQADESPEAVKPETPKDSIITRKLGKTGIEVPVVSMGVMNAENPHLVAAALERGIRLLDTAHYYQRGKNEEMVGTVIKSRPRDSFILASKARPTTVDRASVQTSRSGETRETKESFIEKVEISLKRLKTDYLDILYLHSMRSESDVMDSVAMEAMRALKKSGKVRFVGVSTHRNEPEVIRAAVKSGFYDVVLTAFNFKHDKRAEIEAAMAEAVSKGLGIVAMKTQAGVYWDEERTRPIPMKAALKWALQNPNVHTAIPGFTTFDQLEEDITVLTDLSMSAEEKTALFPAEKLASAPLYCQQCGRCETQCVKGLSLPTLMRGYMYARGYRNLLAAKDTVRKVLDGGLPCESCTNCSVRCPHGIEVRQRALAMQSVGAIPDEFLA